MLWPLPRATSAVYRPTEPLTTSRHFQKQEFPARNSVPAEVCRGSLRWRVTRLKLTGMKAQKKTAQRWGIPINQAYA